MPVYLVAINSYRADGIKDNMPDLNAITAGQPTPADAVAWALQGADSYDVRDVTVELLDTGDQRWSCHGPETMN